MGNDVALQEVVFGFQESVTKGVNAIDVGHTNIHKGEGFSVNVDSTSFTVGASIYIDIETTAAKYVHFKFYEAQAIDSLFRVNVLEMTTSSTHTQGTTPVAYYNKNRAFSSTSLLNVYSDPSDVSVTNNYLLESIILGSSGSNQARGAGARNVDLEWVFKPETEYIIQMTNIGPRTGSGMLYSFWYEEENGQ